MLSFSLISCHHHSGFSYTCLYYTSSKKYSGIVFLFTVFKYYVLPWQMNLNVCSNKNAITTHSINLIQSNFASCYFLEAVILPHILSAEQESMLLPVDLLWHLSGFYLTKPDVNPLNHPKHLDKKKVVFCFHSVSWIMQESCKCRTESILSCLFKNVPEVC